MRFFEERPSCCWCCWCFRAWPSVRQLPIVSPATCAHLHCVNFLLIFSFSTQIHVQISRYRCTPIVDVFLLVFGTCRLPASITAHTVSTKSNKYASSSFDSSRFMNWYRSYYIYMSHRMQLKQAINLTNRPQIQRISANCIVFFQMRRDATSCLQPICCCCCCCCWFSAELLMLLMACGRIPVGVSQPQQEPQQEQQQHNSQITPFHRSACSFYFWLFHFFIFFNCRLQNADTKKRAIGLSTYTKSPTQCTFIVCIASSSSSSSSSSYSSSIHFSFCGNEQ